tara:strand:- start:2741 stop:3151 length:411 start_codon:yes stop_codon:yes gene_type:complete
MKIIDLYNKKNIDNEKKLLKTNTSLVGIFSKDCIHCNNMKSEWNNLKNKLKKINNKNSMMLSMDYNLLNIFNMKSLTNSIKGLPTILILKNGKKIKEYSGDRTSNNMEKFFKKYIRTKSKTNKFNKIKKNNYTRKL